MKRAVANGHERATAPGRKATPWRFVYASRCDGATCTTPADSRRSRSGRGDGIASAAPGGSAQRGFTLIEVIIAFALLALALTLLLGTLSGSAREVRWSADAGRAALHAQSLLDQTGVGESLRPGARDGAFENGRYRWNMQIEPYVDPSKRSLDTIDPGAPRLLRLGLTMEWGEGGPRQRLALQTLRLAQPDALRGTSP